MTPRLRLIPALIAVGLLLSTGALAALLGISPTIPLFNFDANPGTTVITGGTFHATANPTLMLLPGPVPSVIDPATSSSMKKIEIEATLDNACNLIGGVSGDDLVIEGKVNVNPLGPADIRDGILLTGEVTEFGFAAGLNSVFDFRFTVTGGLIADLYTNNDVGVVLTSEGSDFTGDCDALSTGNAKGVGGAIPPILPATGCTPGYWKQKHHFDSWVVTGYDPDQTVASVYGPLDPSVDDLTLEEALKQGGGGLKALMRHSVAALLNAANPDVNSTDFPTTADVIAATQAAVNGGDIEGTKDAFEMANEAGCPLN
jgi:hypothetical protein